MSNPHPAQIKWKDPLALARYIRARLHLIDEGMIVPTGSVRLDMEACVEQIERLTDRIATMRAGLRDIVHNNLAVDVLRKDDEMSADHAD